MGCSASKTMAHPTGNSDHCVNSSPAATRAFSFPTPLVHHPPLKKGDTHHLVSLTSTTYGSLSLLLFDPSPPSMASDHSLSPDSVINASELMHGLEDSDSCSNGFLHKKLPLSSSMEKVKHTTSLPVHSSLLCSKFEETQGIVVYFTSLRGIRKTYEDCCVVRMIFRGFRVSVDERDVSMDSFYRKELREKLGSASKAASLPQVFIRGNSIGGAEEIKQLDEAGELAKILEGFPVAEAGFVICHGCGDARFVPCSTCNGSRKLFEEDGRLKRCPDCNENGLRRCPFCCL